jgi:hypothetical protein
LYNDSNKGEMAMILELLEDEYSIFKFDSDFSVKENIFDGKFISITKTKDEFSVVAVSSLSDDYKKIEK